MTKVKHDPKAVLAKFHWTDPVSILDEMETYEQGFTPYAFYHRVGKSRVYRFSCCGDTVLSAPATDVYLEDDLYRTPHGAACICPYCGASAVNICVGHLRQSREWDYKSLREKRNTVMIWNHDNGLMLECGILSVRWEPGELISDGWDNSGDLCGKQYPEPVTEWAPNRRYFIAPGEALCWTRSEKGWIQRKRFTSFPFYGGLFDDEDGQYQAFGSSAISESDLRYCGATDYFGCELDIEDNPRYYGRSLVAFLIAAARYPQVELLVKLGYPQVVADLLGGIRRDWNWRAKTPYDFFGITKAEFKQMRRAKLTPDELMRWKHMKSIPLDRYITEKRRLTEVGVVVDLGKVAEQAERCGVSLHRGVSYVLKGANVHIWKDYLDMAERLQYDLTQEDVSMPKNLTERHDEVVRTVRYRAAVENENQYWKTLYPHRVQKYGFSMDGLEIVVPKNAQEIIDEGKALQHCVGGYAARHMEGKLTILFLRKSDAPDVPYVTIEMNGTRLVQIHGFRNERDGADDPRTRHQEFIDTWLCWVMAGSQRLSNGAPIIAARKEKTA